MKSVFCLLVVGVLVFANTIEAGYVTNGLIAYWTFDEADIDDETLVDLTGNYHMTEFQAAPLQ